MKALVLTLALAVLVPPRLGHADPVAPPSKAADILVTEAWLRATPHGAPVAGGYVTIKNTGATADRLVGATLPIASRGEVHAMSMTNGVMRMKRLADGLVIAPGKTVTLQPGGYHLMFMKPTAPLSKGETIKGTLIFAKAGSVPVTFAVAGMAARGAPVAAR